MSTELQTTNTVVGFQPEFLEMLLEEAFARLKDSTNGTIKELLEAVDFVSYILNSQIKGDELSEYDIESARKNVESMTRLIWELGGSFYNSTGEYIH